VSFFGHVISLEGIILDPGRVKDVLDWKPPLSITLSAQFFLGWLAIIKDCKVNH
jgi:hypothetical protein